MSKTLDRRELMLAVGSATGVLVAGCSGKPALSTSKDIAEDMAILRRALSLHPGALRYLSSDEIDAGIEQLGQALSAADALDERYLIFQRFLTRLKCGHTYANFFNQSKDVQAALYDRPTRLPFSFRWIDQDMVVTAPAPGVDIAPGSVVTSVNGVKPSEMFKSLLAFTRADGAAMGKRTALLEIQNRSSFEYFDVFHGLVYGAPRGDKHQIKLITPQGQKKKVVAAPISLAERRAIREVSGRAVNREDPLWSFDVRDGVGVLTMPGWGLYKSDWDWATWLDAQLDEAADLRGLVIDNRDNEGGQFEVGAFLLSRLIGDSVAIPKYRRLVRFRTFPEELRAHAGTWDPTFYRIGENARDVGDGFYELKGSDGFQMTIKPRGQRVDVPVILLTSPTNSSASFIFAQIAKASGRMKLVGRETGGNLRGTNGDGFFFTTLPNIGIEFDLPIVGRFPVTPQPDSGISPDIEVTETAQDIAVGRDATLERALIEF